MITRNGFALLTVAGGLVGTGCGESGTTPPFEFEHVTVTYLSSAVSLEAGDTLTVIATASNDLTPHYLSTDGAIADVDSRGLIRAVAPGTAYIYASAIPHPDTVPLLLGADTLQVTVTALVEKRIAIAQVSQNGTPITPTDVSGTIEVTLDLDIPSFFEGEFGILLGEQFIVIDSVSGRSGTSITLDLNVATHRITYQIGPVVSARNGPTDLRAILLSDGTFADLVTDPIPITLNNPSVGYVWLTGGRSVDSTGKEWVRATQIAVAYLDRDPNSTTVVTRARVELEGVDVVRGPPAVILDAEAGPSPDFASADAELYLDRDYTEAVVDSSSSDQAFGGVLGTYRLKSVTFTLLDGTTFMPAWLNSDPTIPLGGSETACHNGTTWHIDTRAPTSVGSSVVGPQP